MDGQKPTTIDEYIAPFPPDVQEILQKIRRTIQETAPQATEAIAYGIPTFKLKGNLIHFGGYKKHIGLYPTPSGIEAFAEELAPYAQAKGTIKLPLDEPIPYDLITRIVEYRVQETQTT